MHIRITKIKLVNFKRFENFEIEPNEKINIIVGDNETGKSSILQAIDLVASGSVRKVENLGLEKLFNVDAINKFQSGERIIKNLPNLIIELYLDGVNDFTLNGKNNTERRSCNGIRLVCKPNPDFYTEITESLKEKDYFPFDFYSIRFSTFADEGYSGYKKKLRTILINSSEMDSNYATNDFIHRAYLQYTEDNTNERVVHKNRYRLMKTNFSNKQLSELNARIPTGNNYKFALKSSSVFSFEDDLMVYEDNVPIDNKGTGRQIFIKTDLALKRSGTNMDVVLIEEPENHLSTYNLRKLVNRLTKEIDGQLFITTHSSFISTRLELNNLQIIQNSEHPLKLNQLNSETAKYFIKAPPAGIVEFILAPKTILVEGPSEYMLMESFYEKLTGHKPEDDNVNILDIRGLSFKRYLEIAKLTQSKVAVITDNDSDYVKNCIDKYKDYNSLANIKIFFEKDNSKNTFEVVFFGDNTEVCEQLFKDVGHMISNKTESAYKLLTENFTLNVPQYIEEAIEWIRD